MTATVVTQPAITREEMVQRVRALGPAFAERAVRYDRDATFPWENFADLKEAGLLALCVPAARGWARGVVRRLRPRLRRDRALLRRDRPHVQHAQRHHALGR